MGRRVEKLPGLRVRGDSLPRSEGDGLREKLPRPLPPRDGCRRQQGCTLGPEIEAELVGRTATDPRPVSGALESFGHERLRPTVHGDVDLAYRTVRDTPADGRGIGPGGDRVRDRSKRRAAGRGARRITRGRAGRSGYVRSSGRSARGKEEQGEEHVQSKRKPRATP